MSKMQLNVEALQVTTFEVAKAPVNDSKPAQRTGATGYCNTCGWCDWTV
ncbi:hypothetical protein [Longimicrobium sp.]|nr:hypothetical protein [Longimicrobium sp.]HEX6038235.1 hypothetical protein [Longimicrobium sp.]